MDIVLLSKLVRDLLCSNDKVSLPGLGVFSFEDVPASFSDKGFTINPPYRKVVFNLSSDCDSLVAMTYAGANNIPLLRAERIVNDCIAQMASSLKMTKCVSLPDFGKLKMTRTGIVFFVSDEGLSLQPRYDLLQSISLKSIAHQSAPAPENAPEIVPVLSTANEPAPELEPAPEPDPVPATDNRRRMSPWAKALVYVACAAAAFFLFLAIAGRVKPSIVDPLLYNEQQLEILYSRI